MKKTYIQPLAHPLSRRSPFSSPKGGNKSLRLLFIVVYTLLSPFGGMKGGPTLQAMGQQRNTSYMQQEWIRFVRGVDEAWLGTPESVDVAENVLYFQSEIGGWPKYVEMHLPLTPERKVRFTHGKKGMEPTLDNAATTSEITFFAKMYQKVKDERYKNAVLKGIRYVIAAQYANGGWPQYYPALPGYYTRITYNDDCMVHSLNLLLEVVNQNPLYAFADKALREECKRSFDKGIDCVLKTQIIKNGKRTVWCAQHDEFTLEPVAARSYELPSFSGAESVPVVLLLMRIDNPSALVKEAVTGAVRWFEDHKIYNLRVVNETDWEGNTDKMVIEDPYAPPIWARFYDLELEVPIFADHDGVKRFNQSDIGYERRNNYSWYTYGPARLLKAYPTWAQKWVKGTTK